ncbi:hypothetical protein K502DRAFT_353903 [Neoconidiobolus thromboides FSU 785]|nr:hypothetical protein K502DRAFT_353903 [Neoconidiobolus thromboides FSU 785]
MKFLILFISFFLLSVFNLSNEVEGFSYKPWNHHKRGKAEITAACASAIGVGSGIYKACNSKSIADTVDAVKETIAFCGACGGLYAAWRVSLAKKKSPTDIEAALTKAKTVAKGGDQKKITDFFKKMP